MYMKMWLCACKYSCICVHQSFIQSQGAVYYICTNKSVNEFSNDLWMHVPSGIPSCNLSTSQVASVPFSRNCSRLKKRTPQGSMFAGSSITSTSLSVSSMLVMLKTKLLHKDVAKAWAQMVIQRWTERGVAVKFHTYMFAHIHDHV